MGYYVLLGAVVLVLCLQLAALMIFVRRRSNPAEERAAQTLAALELKLAMLNEAVKAQEKSLREELAGNRGEIGKALLDNRMEINNSFKNLQETTNQVMEVFANRLHQFTGATEERFQVLSKATETRLDAIRETLDSNLKKLKEENAEKLEEMRKTVDEKLRESVEKRFNESFKLISERLEMVHKGLGEMQNLANGVGDLKRALTNVKTRGIFGEIQLGTILSEYLSPGQYETNVCVKPDSPGERVEFAVKMPGNSADAQPILLPIDSKFPLEDYQRLTDAYSEKINSPEEFAKLHNEFVKAVRREAAKIRSKYINPPMTTDFAIMFVPTEGLYAEIMRAPGLFEDIQRNYKIAIVGPANLVAFLSSLQMGFRTLAIEQRSHEIWQILGAVKIQFDKFGDTLGKTKRGLQAVMNHIEEVEKRTRVMNRKLREVEAPADGESLALINELALPDVGDAEES